MSLCFHHLCNKMENYSYGGNASYPDSGNSSPRSREIDFENPPPWEDQSSQPNYKVKFMCSYGGNITPRPHDYQLSYVGGETKILSVERNIKFAPFIAKLSALCDADVCFKYQLPGEDLDALISVTNDDDLEHMMHEYDRLFRGMAKPARLRLFLFAVNGRSETERPASREPKTDRGRFVESGHDSVDGSSPPANVLRGNSNVDYLFAVEKTGATVVTSPPLHPVVAPVAVVPVQTTQLRDERVVGADPVEIQRRIQELQRIQIGHEQQQQSQNAVYHQPQNRAADVINNNGGNGNMNVSPAYAGDYYKIPEQRLPVQNLPTNYWQENKQIPTSGSLKGGGYNDPPPPQPPQHHQQQPVYMIPAGQGNVYHAPIRAQNPTPTTQGFYSQPLQPQQQQQLYGDQPPVPQQQQQLYRDQPPLPQPQQQQMYNVLTSQSSPPQPKMVQAYPPPEVVRQNVVERGGAGEVYAQVTYDSTGRQVYYTTPGGVMPQQQAAYHAQQQGIAVNPVHEGKIVITKVP